MRLAGLSNCPLLARASRRHEDCQAGIRQTIFSNTVNFWLPGRMPHCQPASWLAMSLWPLLCSDFRPFLHCPDRLCHLATVSQALPPPAWGCLLLYLSDQVFAAGEGRTPFWVDCLPGQPPGCTSGDLFPSARLIVIHFYIYYFIHCF